jgi:hypothetical protein
VQPSRAYPQRIRPGAGVGVASMQRPGTMAVEGGTMDRRLILTVLCLALLFTGLPALAQPPAPSNDLIRNATRIPSLPFLVELDARGSHTDGPRGCGNRGSVFYRFRSATDVRVQADTIGSSYDTVLTVFRGPIRDLRRVVCNDDAIELDSAVRFTARAGVRYIFMIARCCGFGPGRGGQLDFSLTLAPSVPFTFDVAVTAATADSSTGDVTLEGTFECTHRSVGQLGGVASQLRDGLFIARLEFFALLVCTEPGPMSWSRVVEPLGDVAFAPGDARFRWQVFATNGFRDIFVPEVVETITIT